MHVHHVRTDALRPARSLATLTRMVVIVALSAAAVGSCSPADSDRTVGTVAEPAGADTSSTSVAFETSSRSPGMTVDEVDVTVAETTSIAPAATPTTIAPAMTLPMISPADAFVSEFCDALRTGGFETRRSALAGLSNSFLAAGGVGDAAAAVASRCGDDLHRLDGANAVLDRVGATRAALTEEDMAISYSDIVCDDGAFSVSVTNETAYPIGVHLSLQMVNDDDPRDWLASSLLPLVIWSTAPGATEQVSGTYRDVLSRTYCWFDAEVFDADPSMSDAGLGATARPELTGDDPAVWLPALLDLEVSANGSGDADLAALIEDIRSFSYPRVLARTRDVTRPAMTAFGRVDVCEKARSAPDPDHISLVYSEQTDHGPILWNGLFRRGADRQWRWLSTGRYFERSIHRGCRSVDVPLEMTVVDVTTGS